MDTALCNERVSRLFQCAQDFLYTTMSNIYIRVYMNAKSVSELRIGHREIDCYVMDAVCNVVLPAAVAFLCLLVPKAFSPTVVHGGICIA